MCSARPGQPIRHLKPVPEDLSHLFQPRMPAVDIRPGMRVVFADARARVANPDPKVGLAPGQRCLGILTPGRMTMFVPAPKPGTVPPEFVQQVEQRLPAEPRLNVTAIAFTELQPLMQDMARCIPHLGQLLGFAYVGHNVIVFEGHSSAFEAAISDSGLVLIDSGMLPFLQKDWAEAAFRSAPAGCRVLMYRRETRHVLPVVRSRTAPGWRYGEPDGENSYVNCLLTTLARRPSLPVQVTTGDPAPDLLNLAASLEERDWASELPFNYGALDASKVIAAIQRFAKLGNVAPGQSVSGTLKTQLATGAGKTQPVSFQLRLSEDAEGRRSLTIERALA